MEVCIQIVWFQRFVTVAGENAICRCEFAHSLRYTLGVMAVMVEVHHTGCEPGLRAEIAAVIEHALSDRPGDWSVSIIGSQANDRWEMKIIGPNAFERSYTLERTAGEHETRVIASLVAKMVPRSVQ